jgi:hypothetical protein
MTWVLLTAVALIVVALGLLLWTTQRLRRQISELERRLNASTDEPSMPRVASDLQAAPLGEGRAEFVITGLGDQEAVEPAPTVEARLFGDLVLKEAVVQAASLAHGVRRALSPENRNRIRFEIKREVKRSRRQRRSDLREARRQWEARQRAGVQLDAEDPAA